jgi:hypothetical protein
MKRKIFLGLVLIALLFGGVGVQKTAAVTCDQLEVLITTLNVTFDQGNALRRVFDCPYADGTDGPIPVVSTCAEGVPFDSSGHVCPRTNRSLTVTSPNGGETWTAGQSRTIRWRSKNIPSSHRIQVDLIDTSYGLASGQLISSGGVKVTMPTDLPPGDYRLKISDMNDQRVFDYSDKPFTVKNSYTNLYVAPVGISLPSSNAWYRVDQSIPLKVSVGSSKKGTIRLYLVSTQEPGEDKWLYVGDWKLNSGNVSNTLNTYFSIAPSGPWHRTGPMVLKGFWNSDDGSERTEGATSARFTLTD